MNRSGVRGRWSSLLSNRSAPKLIAATLVVIGLAIGATVHMGFMSLLAAGAFGPGALRQLGLLDDLDEFQKQAALRAGLRAYLVAGLLLMAVVVADNWNRLSLGAERIPASTVVVVMLVVYYSSYCLSFWDVATAVSRVLLAFGLLWLAFVVLSHAGEPLVMAMEGAVVAGPFIVGAMLCRRFPRTVGLLLVVIGVWTIFFFHMLPTAPTSSEDVLKHSFTFVLIPLPLLIAGVALVADGSSTTDERDGDRL